MNARLVRKRKLPSFQPILWRTLSISQRLGLNKQEQIDPRSCVQENNQQATISKNDDQNLFFRGPFGFHRDYFTINMKKIVHLNSKKYVSHCDNLKFDIHLTTLWVLQRFYGGYFLLNTNKLSIEAKIINKKPHHTLIT